MFVVWVLFVFGFPQPTVEAADFKRDPIDQLFRRAPMAGSPRSIVIAMATNLHLAFDAHLLRTHTVWSGPGLNLRGPPYTGQKTPFLCDFTGTVLWSNPPVFPWSVGGQSPEDLTRRPPGARFKAISTEGVGVTLTYELTLPDGKTVRIIESPGLKNIGDVRVVARQMEISPCTEELRFLAHAEPGKAKATHRESSGFVLSRQSDVLLVAARSGGSVSWDFSDQAVDYEDEVWAENRFDSELRRRRVTGHEARFYLRIPAHTHDLSVEIFSAVCAGKAEADQVERTLANGPRTPGEINFAASFPKRAAASAARVFAGDPGFNHPAGGDAYYRIEHFPVPKEMDLLVGGMGWLSNGDLAVCTWPGEVYIVHDPQGPATQATYRRFARGLNEPLGLHVLNDQIYVTQKCELTRLVDTDGNGEADLYETVSDGWGFTGNYHSFAFGPLVDGASNFYVLLAGQRGRWEVPFAGWCVELSPNSGRLEGFCSGLRAPNGWTAFGPSRDFFATDNQGEWVGTCKLNHLQRGKFYGFPSASPAPYADYARPKDFEPPAVWFPRKLSASASGITVINDDRFGPFQGQMLVGDFQNGVVMRVALEKVKSEWQGAVWPFMKGFLGAVNRLTLGPDGKLYVGGCKRAWSTSAPMEYSLERAGFTGETPFEVKEVHAKRDGLELVFTKPVDAATATNTDDYAVSQFDYKYSGSYGSPEIDHNGRDNNATPIAVARAGASPDRLKVKLTLNGWRAGYVTAVRIVGMASAAGEELWHDTLYYTLNRIPD